MGGTTQVLFSSATGEGQGEESSPHSAWAEIRAHLTSSDCGRHDDLSLLLFVHLYSGDSTNRTCSPSVVGRRDEKMPGTQMHSDSISIPTQHANYACLLRAPGPSRDCLRSSPLLSLGKGAEAPCRDPPACPVSTQSSRCSALMVTRPLEGVWKLT